MTTPCRYGKYAGVSFKNLYFLVRCFFSKDAEKGENKNTKPQTLPRVTPAHCQCPLSPNHREIELVTTVLETEWSVHWKNFVQQEADNDVLVSTTAPEVPVSTGKLQGGKRQQPTLSTRAYGKTVKLFPLTHIFCEMGYIGVGFLPMQQGNQHFHRTPFFGLFFESSESSWFAHSYELVYVLKIYLL